jgi:hypothetical protein
VPSGTSRSHPHRVFGSGQESEETTQALRRVYEQSGLARRAAAINNENVSHVKLGSNPPPAGAVRPGPASLHDDSYPIQVFDARVQRVLIAIALRDSTKSSEVCAWLWKRVRHCKANLISGCSDV